MFQQPGATRRLSSVGFIPCRTPLVHRVENLTEDVKLKLLRRGITEANGCGPFISRQPGKLHLGEPAVRRRART